MVRALREPHLRQYEGAGVDTLHLTFRQDLGTGIGEIEQEIKALLDALQIAAGVTRRARGLFGYENGITFQAGILADWTPLNGEGQNPGYASIQIKGEFLKSLGPEESCYVLLRTAEWMPYRCTRIDLQMTNCDTPLVPEIIRDFRAGRLRVLRKAFFEPKGLELTGGHYPQGATLCHGSRVSENYARQYDKHLQEAIVGRNPEPGPPRRRDEVELKGKLAQQAYQDLVGVIAAEAEAGAGDCEVEARFAQTRIRSLLPLRDISEYEGTDLPKNWSGTAPEPAWWTELFSEDAVRIRRDKGPSKAFLARVQYPHTAFAGRVVQQYVLDRLDAGLWITDPEAADDYALLLLRDRFARNAKEGSLQELLENLPESQHAEARGHWFGVIRAAADADDNDRAEG